MSAIDSWCIFQALQNQAWQEAIGKLRSIVAIAGSTHDKSDSGIDWLEFEKHVEKFIEETEENFTL